MSPLSEAMVINGAVLFATLEADLGPHRKIGWFRLLRTPVVIAAIIPLFIHQPVTHGNGLLVELAVRDLRSRPRPGSDPGRQAR